MTFFTLLGAVEPEEAPNFDFIPHIADNYHVKKFDGNPLVGQELHAYAVNKIHKDQAL